MNTKNGKGMILFTAARKLCGRHQPFSCRLFFLLAPLSPKSFRLAARPPGRATSVSREEFPNRTTIYKNIVTDLGADPTGKVDAAPIIQRAIHSCPAGQVVYMPAGTFLIATSIYAAAKSNFTLRGAGQGQTILHVTTNSVCLSTVAVMLRGRRRSIGAALRPVQQRVVIRSPYRRRLNFAR